MYSQAVLDELKQYILRLMGGYFIDSDRLSNPVYKELVQNYLSTLVGHGVQILFFPEIKLSKNGEIGRINREFLFRMMDALYKNMEEIALIPVEISYYKRPYEIDHGISDDILSIRNVLGNRIKINFSDPVFISDFSTSRDTIDLLSKNILSRWKADSYIYPHYIFCKIIKDNNYQLDMNEASKYIIKFLQKHNLQNKYKVKNIQKKGLDFISRNGIGKVNDNALSIIKKEEIDYYSNMIYN